MKQEMEYMTLQEGMQELHLSFYELVRLMAESAAEHHMTEGQLYVSRDDLMRHQWQQFQNEDLPRALESLLPLVNHYMRRYDEEEMGAEKRMGSLVTVLYEEEPELLKELTEKADDGFYALVQEMCPALLYEPVMEPKYIHQRARKSRAKEPQGISERSLQREAAGIVRKVSKYFDVDLPERIIMKDGQESYATIQYRQRGNRYQPAGMAITLSSSALEQKGLYQPLAERRRVVEAQP